MKYTHFGNQIALDRSSGSRKHDYPCVCILLRSPLEVYPIIVFLLFYACLPTVWSICLALIYSYKFELMSNHTTNVQD